MSKNKKQDSFGNWVANDQEAWEAEENSIEEYAVSESSEVSDGAFVAGDTQPLDVSFLEYQNASEMITVKILNTDQFDGRYVVYDVNDPSKTYLIPAEDLQFSYGQQKVTQDVIRSAKRPYNWDEEIDKLIMTRDQIRNILYWGGLVEKKENFDIREALLKILQRGNIPVI